MNLVPIAVAGAVIVAVPPLRRRVVSVTAAVYESTSDVIVTTARSRRDVTVAAIDGVVDVGTVALKGAPKAEGDGRLASSEPRRSPTSGFGTSVRLPASTAAPLGEAPSATLPNPDSPRRSGGGRWL